jgi:NADPH2:quinone reductase
MNTPMLSEAKAVVIREYGPPSVLRYETVSLAPLKPDEVRIRSSCSAVNHTDLEIRAGNWPIRKLHPFPYVPGVEVVGAIAEVGAKVTDFRAGDPVISMMQGMGGVRAELDGGYAEYVTVRADSVASFPSTIAPHALAAVGLAGVTAYEGLRRIGPLRNKRILVTGAAGGVGSSATAIAHAENAYVIGVVMLSGTYSTGG